MKEVVECPVCWKKSNIPSNKHINYNCPRCNAFIEADNGRIVSFKERISISSHDTFEKSTKDRESNDFDDFEYIYSKKTTVRELFSRVNYFLRKRFVIVIIVASTTFVILASLSRRCERIKTWDKAYADYIYKNTNTNISNEAQTFIEGLLKNGREKGYSDVFISFDPVIKVVDWQDFSIEARNYVNEGYKYIYKENNITDPLPLDSSPKRIKGKINTNKSFLEDIIVETLQAQLDALFSPNPVVLKKQSTAQLRSDNSLASVNVKYIITTLTSEDSILNVPVLYRYINSTNYRELNYFTSKDYVFKGYLLATKINWKTTFSIPEMDINFSIDSESETTGNITGIRRDPYDDIMETAFKNYALSMAEGVGVKVVE